MARKLKKDEAETTEIDVVTNEGSIAQNHEIAVAKTLEVKAQSELNQAQTDVAPQVATADVADACGGALRAARIAQDLSTQAIAKQLRLGNAQIEALEQNEFSALPEPTIVKGFIRNYAKLLKIPAEPILAAYAELMPKTDQYAFALGPGINMKMSENSKLGSTRYLILTLLLLLMLVAWFFYQHYIQKPDAVNPTPEAADIFPEELALQMPTALELENDTLAVENAAMDDQLSETDPFVETDDNEAKAELVAEASEPVTPAPIAATRLLFNAKQETWISVVNQSGEEVYNKILYAGKREVIDVEQPAEIVVGNAQGATLTIDGESMDLAPHTRMNVARIRLNP